MLPELAAVVTELDELCAQAKQIIQTIEPAGLNYKPGDDFNSISALVTHLAGSMKWYLGEVIAGRVMRRDRDAEFRTSGTDASALARVLDDALTFAREMLEALTPAMLDEPRQARTRVYIMRHAIVHVVAHTAEHVGHMEITAQLYKSRLTWKTE